MMKTKIEFYVNYKWYGYEGVGYCNSNYISDNIQECIDFINEFIRSHNQVEKDSNIQWKEFYDKSFKWDQNGFIDSIENRVYKRTVIEEPADMVKELRDSKINELITK